MGSGAPHAGAREPPARAATPREEPRIARPGRRCKGDRTTGNRQPELELRPAGSKENRAGAAAHPAAVTNPARVGGPAPLC